MVCDSSLIHALGFENCAVEEQLNALSHALKLMRFFVKKNFNFIENFINIKRENGYGVRI